jgi:hypothetical protein
MYPFSGFPSSIKPVLLYSGAANFSTSCDTVCMKNLHKLWFFIDHAGANDTDCVLSLYEATDVAAGTTAAVTTTCPVWTAVGAGTTVEDYTRQTDAYSITVDPATQNPVLGIIEWDPAKHTAGYDCIKLVATGAGGHGSNTLKIYALGIPRYPSADQVPILTD